MRNEVNASWRKNMNYQEWKDEMEKKGMPILKPMDHLAQMDINRVLAHQADKQSAYSGDALS